jgi:hypothetical protein
LLSQARIHLCLLYLLYLYKRPAVAGPPTPRLALLALLAQKYKFFFLRS